MKNGIIVKAYYKILNKELKCVEYKDNVMKIGDKEIVLKNSVYELIETEDKVFVLLDILPKENSYTYDDYHNLYCYSNTGKRLWQIGKGIGDDKSCYVGMEYEKGILYVANFAGINYKVNVETGELSEPRCLK